MFGQVTVDVDRDSVAMGDDMLSHARTLRVGGRTRLSALLLEAAPDIRVRGWSWVSVIDGNPVAVWSVDHGVQLLVPDRRLIDGGTPREVHFRYFLQMDPAWLHRRLADGAPPNREALSKEFQPLAEADAEREERRRERESPTRYVSAACVSALEAFGACIDLHNDRLLRFDLLGERWVVRRSDTMTGIHRVGSDVGASIRPLSSAEPWLVTAAAA